MFKKHLTNPGIRECLLIGGVNVKDQLRDLQNGVEIVVGTPGRIEDFVEKGKLDLSNVSDTSVRAKHPAQLSSFILFILLFLHFL